MHNSTRTVTVCLCCNHLIPPNSTSHIEVHDLCGGDGPTEAEDGRGDDDGRGGADSVDDAAHAERQEELGEEHHAGHHSYISTKPAHLLYLRVC